MHETDCGSTAQNSVKHPGLGRCRETRQTESRGVRPAAVTMPANLPLWCFWTPSTQATLTWVFLDRGIGVKPESHRGLIRLGLRKEKTESASACPVIASPAPAGRSSVGEWSAGGHLDGFYTLAAGMLGALSLPAASVSNPSNGRRPCIHLQGNSACVAASASKRRVCPLAHARDHNFFETALFGASAKAGVPGSVRNGTPFHYPPLLNAGSASRSSRIWLSSVSK